jgi:glucose-fructose oxidoreductase
MCVARLAFMGTRREPLRFAVVGMGHFAQSAILPAFKNVDGAQLSAIVSGDEVKRRKLAAKYKVRHAVDYADYDALLRSGDVDAVYVASPNRAHADHAVRAANARIHVLCEKPMATSEAECARMIEAADGNGVKLMIAYRLHFEPANLAAIKAIQQGKLGELRYFDSTFSMQVESGNSRLSAELGGGPLPDIGIYCVNAARYLFRAEPLEVLAMSASRAGDKRFKEVDEQVSVLMRFPDQRIASFTVSFGASESARYDVVGTEGSLRLEPAYHHSGDLAMQLRVGKRTSRRTFKPHDQVAAELDYFTECVRTDTRPEPSGHEGLMDIRILTAIQQSIATARPIAIEPIDGDPRPQPTQERNFAPPGDDAPLVHVEAPSAH